MVREHGGAATDLQPRGDESRDPRNGHNGMEWNGMEWNGMEWNEMKWDGMEWNGM